MKFKEYLKEQKQYKLSDYEKFSLYEKILEKQHHNKKIFRPIISMRQLTYFSILGFLLIGIYGTYFLNTTSQEENWIIISNTYHSIDTVNAGYIAKVIEFTWDFHIQQHNKTLKTNAITNNDTVILKKGTTITFDVIDGSKIRMVGPAKFSIQKNKNTPYRLYIHEWAFTNIENTKKDQNMEIIVNEHVIIKTGKENTNFQIAKKGNDYFVNNKGSSLTISNTKKNKTTQTLNKDNILTIRKENDITTIQDKKQFVTAIAHRDISQSFDLTTPLPEKDTTEPTRIKDTTKEKKEKTTTKNTENTWIESTITASHTGTEKRETTTSWIAINIDEIIKAESLEINQDAINKLVDEKKIFDEQQQQQINTTLNLFFIKSDCKDILSARLSWNEKYENTSIKKLQKKIIMLGNILGASVDPTANFSAIKNNFATIQKILKTEYYTPDEYFSIIQQATSWITIIENSEIWSLDEHTAEIEAKKILP